MSTNPIPYILYIWHFSHLGYYWFISSDFFRRGVSLRFWRNIACNLVKHEDVVENNYVQLEYNLPLRVLEVRWSGKNMLGLILKRLQQSTNRSVQRRKPQFFQKMTLSRIPENFKKLFTKGLAQVFYNELKNRRKLNVSHWSYPHERYFGQRGRQFVSGVWPDFLKDVLFMCRTKIYKTVNVRF